MNSSLAVSSSGRLSLRYAGLRFELLRPDTVDAARDATSCPTSLMLFAHYGDPDTHWHRQTEADALGDCLTFTVRKSGRIVGVCALLPFRDGVRTATYLHPDARGTGTNQACKRILFDAARTAGLPLYSTVRSTNETSLAAMRKTWPGAEPELVHEVDRDLWVFTITEAPRGGWPLSSAERGALRKIIVPTPFGQRHLVPKRAPRVRRPRVAPLIELAEMVEMAAELHVEPVTVTEAVATLVENAETWPVTQAPEPVADEPAVSAGA